MKYDYLIVGAGFSGCVLAERLSSIGKKILLIDKRDHIGGNCYDYIDDAGVLIHKYGPHYFRTNSKEIYNYLSNFTNFIKHKYKVKIKIKNKIYTFPINMTTLEEFFNIKFNCKKELQKFLDLKRDKSITNPKNAEEQVLMNIGKELYESFYKGYTEKQWGCKVKELEPSVTARIPIRFNRDDNYVNETIQVMPKKGYTKLFKKMLKNPLITLNLNCNYSTNLNKKASKIIWSGCIDEFFKYRYGKLPHRSLNFKFKSFYNKEFIQKEGQINFPSKDVPYTRIVEIKHVTHQKCNNTTISIEYPCSNGEPYYPIPNKNNNLLRKKYIEKSKFLKNIYFVGRLGRYRYMNMDQCIESALKLFKKLKNNQ